MPIPQTPEFQKEARIGRPGSVSFQRICKSFSGVPVLQEVTFEVQGGRMVGLVGENGAGKSTLMNLLGGNLRPDTGAMLLDGRSYSPAHPDEARAAGIAFVHQELNLFPNLSIEENLHLNAFPRVGGGPGRGGLPWIDRRAMRERSVRLLREVGLEVAPGTLVERLDAGERQLVEIARALGADARILILDEPTTSLSARECERLFALLDGLRARGLTLIYISHALGDVMRLCDDIVVLRDGALVGQGTAKEFTVDRLVALMVGRQLERLFPERSSRGRELSGPPLLELSAVTQPGVVREVSLEVHAGEVVGLFGLMGAGRSELARILFGLDPLSSGEIRLAGTPLEGPPRERIRRGLAFLTEDRREEGLCLEASIGENLTLVALARYCRAPLHWLDAGRLGEAIRRMRGAVLLSSQARDTQPVRTLSGGNQQKVVLGKWLLAEPRVLILDEPTRGIDVGAKHEIYRLIHQHAERGSAVLAISSELEELIGICDRILVMRHGSIASGFSRGQFDREAIMAAALHASRS